MWSWRTSSTESTPVCSAILLQSPSRAGRHTGAPITEPTALLRERRDPKVDAQGFSNWCEAKIAYGEQPFIVEAELTGQR